LELPGGGSKLKEEGKKIDDETPLASSGQGEGVVGGGAVTPSGFLDPRSPTFEYKRTPLALGEKNHGQKHQQILSLNDDGDVDNINMDAAGAKVNGKER
jgi:hypothetical protein